MSKTWQLLVTTLLSQVYGGQVNKLQQTFLKKLQTKTDNLDRIKASAIQYESCPIAITTTTIITWPTAVPV